MSLPIRKTNPNEFYVGLQTGAKVLHNEKMVKIFSSLEKALKSTGYKEARVFKVRVEELGIFKVQEQIIHVPEDLCAEEAHDDSFDDED